MSTESTPVIFFDIPGSGKEKSWSLNMLRIRYVLNYKKIPHTTHWVEYPEIKPLFKELGIPPSGQTDKGEDLYTCPAIKFTPSDGTPAFYVSDSFRVAEFLEEQYPNPPIFTNPPVALQKKLVDEVRNDLFLSIGAVLVQGSYKYVNEASKPYFRSTREAAFGMKIEEMCPDDAAVERFRAISREKFGAFLKDVHFIGPFFFGREPTYLDFVIASLLKWMQIVIEPEVWSQLKGWNDGIWGKLLASIEERGLGVIH